MPGFSRTFSTRPSVAVLLAVSGVVVLDLAPQQPINGAKFGKIALVGEFEDGPFNTPTDMLSSSDQSTKFGSFGFQYGSSKYQYPCALQSGGTEFWNGNAWVQSAGLTFGALCLVRADTSVGSVAISPLAYVQSSLKAPYVLDNAVTTIFSIDGAGDTTATWAAAAAVKTGSGGVFSGVLVGDTIAISYDGGSAVTTTFESGDTSAAAIVSRINTAFGFTFASVSSGQLRFTSPTKGTGSQVVITASTLTTTLGLTADAVTNSTTNGTGDAVNIALVSAAEFKTKIEAANAGCKVTTGALGYQRIVSKTAGSGTVYVKTHTAADGFAVGTAATTAALPSATVVPAGTRCSDGSAAGTFVVTMQSTTIAKAATASTSFKVRPAIDDGTYAGASGAAIDTINDQPSDLEWSVTNPLALGDALSSVELDAAYAAAIASTIGPGDDTKKKINGIVSARQSNSIRAAIQNNETTASAEGHYRRRGFICPPNGSTAATIVQSAAPGVGAYRDEGMSYAAGAVRCVLQPMIDAGYADTDGAIERHPDLFLASRWSSLTPGYNPGQLPEDPTLQWGSGFVIGIETAAASWDLTTYAAFKTAGVCASQYSSEGLTFEQGVTTVDPAVDSSRTTISRATLAGYIGDTLAAFALKDVKRQATEKRVERMRLASEGFLNTLTAPLGDTVSQYSFTPVPSGINNVQQYEVLAVPVESQDVILFSLSVGAGAITISGGLDYV